MHVCPRPLQEVLFVPYHGRLPKGRLECISDWTPFTPPNLFINSNDDDEKEGTSVTTASGGASRRLIHKRSSAGQQQQPPIMPRRGIRDSSAAAFNGTLLIECTSRSLRGSSKRVSGYAGGRAGRGRAVAGFGAPQPRTPVPQSHRTVCLN